MSVTEEPAGTTMTMIDEAYEFSAPRFFDFTKGESEEEMRKAELWFDSALSYAPSPFMSRIKEERSFKFESLCNFSEAAEQIQKAISTDCSKEMKHQSELVSAETKEIEVTPSKATEENSGHPVIAATSTDYSKETRHQSELISAETKVIEVTSSEATEENNGNLVNVATSTDCSKEMKHQSELISAETNVIEMIPGAATKETNGNLVNVVSANKDTSEEQMGETKCTQENGRRASSNVNIEPAAGNKETSKDSVQVGTAVCTPKPVMNSGKGVTNSKKQQTAKKIASLVKNPSVLRGKSQLLSSQAKRDNIVKKTIGTPTNFALENQAIKRQKLDGGRSRQILDVKPQNLPHKSKLGRSCNNSNLCTSTAKTCKDERKVYVRERDPAAPFVSMAEMMQKFNSSTRDLSLPQYTSLSHGKPKLTLTRPKEPALETAQRVRSIRVKSTAELEEEMMAKIPKFKARPLNKKVLEGPTLPAVPRRSAPEPPEFHEFHLETMARANLHAETSSVASTEVSRKDNQWKPWGLTEPKSPVLQTLLRARPPKVKTSAELELEELDKAPKFKARPLNKKIFESKGDLGISCTAKKHVTKPQEFHFSINDRIPPPKASIFDSFERLSLNSEPRQENPLPRNTKPNPFHLYTEERGAEKERKQHKQLEEERARVPKANPYPYTTDYPVIPPKPEPKRCTRPEPFQLESLVRHEEEIQRELEERKRKEKEEVEMRIFKAQPVLKEDPIPVPEKVRKPLTTVQEFNLNLDNRAVVRAEFDQKIKEKEMMYKRYRDESEAARMIEEEKALKQLRRTMVPHARPIPKFDNPFCPQKSNKVTTKAKSPLLRVLERRARRKFMCAGSAISSVTAHR